jgi:hypothetical protein
MESITCGHVRSFSFGKRWAVRGLQPGISIGVASLIYSDSPCAISRQRPCGHTTHDTNARE